MNYKQTLIVNYDGDLHDFEGYIWQEDGLNVEYELCLVTKLDCSHWEIIIRYNSETFLETSELIRAFEREFKTSMRATIMITPAEYQRLLGICLAHDLKLNVKSIEE